jgi:hypothetical protein
MPFHRCTICLEDGSVVAQDISVALSDSKPEAPDEWFGTITITHLVSLAAGQRYQLVLDDGRKGMFSVRRNTFAGDINRAVAIQGLGPLR